MRGVTNHSRRLAGRVHAALAGLLGAVALLSAGCEDTLGWLSSGLGFDGWGWILPDAAVVQDVLDYRQGVFDAANDAWDAYIRGE